MDDLPVPEGAFSHEEHIGPEAHESHEADTLQAEKEEKPEKEFEGEKGERPLGQPQEIKPSTEQEAPVQGLATETKLEVSQSDTTTPEVATRPVDPLAKTAVVETEIRKRLLAREAK